MIFVHGFAPETTKSDIMAIASKFGTVVRLSKKPKNKYCFIDYATVEQQEAALKGFHGYRLHKQRLGAELAKNPAMQGKILRPSSCDTSSIYQHPSIGGNGGISMSCGSSTHPSVYFPVSSSGVPTKAQFSSYAPALVTQCSSDEYYQYPTSFPPSYTSIKPTGSSSHFSHPHSTQSSIQHIFPPQQVSSQCPAGRTLSSVSSLGQPPPNPSASSQSIDELVIPAFSMPFQGSSGSSPRLSSRSVASISLTPCSSARSSSRIDADVGKESSLGMTPRSARDFTAREVDESREEEDAKCEFLMDSIKSLPLSKQCTIFMNLQSHLETQGL
ncbi:hypothetical protein ADUPG1_009193 [Aduncisulcus paluster]|uniref:RRM domain-containing protein n=1 Tax=Aduncisulcus paluster TaxID=2918883 RepID=A0ABQ5KWZ0_9EUKA|nr:hypothetical protein ADUPG1_009193 [Aduncisulcus paluster]|eukprot:gnl/Carplike_NY0171/4595_a6243_313.p1 GENE.gnl/Carplike_NY0171/4595_a6243_313~~gnl/Carplike_NY0171/4595_a6243_313.p1  ORF type:complete len:329 (+),score=55.69 gnl/Carplike_NY0171/4595_a6243_313:2-988(+)